MYRARPDRSSALRLEGTEAVPQTNTVLLFDQSSRVAVLCTLPGESLFGKCLGLGSHLQYQRPMRWGGLNTLRKTSRPESYKDELQSIVHRWTVGKGLAARSN